MQIQRTLLFVAIGVVTYLMVLAWKDDHSQQETQPAPTVAESSQPEAGDFPDEADAPEAVVDAELDVDITEKPQAQDNHIITVKTDVYDIEIDLNGGDISKVALLHYPQKVDSPDTPFVLLTPDRSYAAQSGFIGRQGTHGSTVAKWVSEHQHYEPEDGEDSLTVTLQLKQENGTLITRKLLFSRDSYDIKNQYIIDNSEGNAPWRASLFGQITRDGSSDPSKDTTGFA